MHMKRILFLSLLAPACGSGAGTHGARDTTVPAHPAGADSPRSAGVSYSSLSGVDTPHPVTLVMAARLSS
jgi:hypothetical protein